MSYDWKTALGRALKKNRQDAPHRYLQLATQGQDGYPANRTVVFRGFSDSGELMIVTDQRSAKIEQLALSPKVEACWYFSRTREQFRIRGRVCTVDGDSRRDGERAEAWARLSAAAREQFFWPPPGKPLTSSAAIPVSDAPSPVFTLLLLEPECVDHLVLTTPQQRFLSINNDDGWCSEAVNP